MKGQRDAITRGVEIALPNDTNYLVVKRFATGSSLNIGCEMNERFANISSIVRATRQMHDVEELR